MQARKYLIGMIAGLAAAVGFTSVASAAVTGLSIESTYAPTKGDKKIRNGVSVFFASNDTHEGELPCSNALSVSCRAYPPSTQSLITFTKNLRFNPGNLPDCNLSQLIGKTSAGALAACPRSHVGEGANTQLFSDGRRLNGTITAFNGSPSGGNPSLYLHVEFPGVTTKPILNGVIQGNRLTVQIPPVQGSVIERFAVNLDKIVSGKKRDKRTGKVKKTFYLMANCSERNFTTREDVTYQDGSTLSATTPGRCTRKKKK
ncbi:MAG TPA: hypothetical protein VF052_07060 [Solirubrobacterales bacterium]